ncbi:MAG: V-type ATP synthase subunit E [Ruminococcus sp.]|nr:V-type ATP synthase subunit E [Ruminococcus sp.]
MTGLDKILAQIKADSDSLCADISEKSKTQCDSVLAQAQTRAEVILKEAESKAQRIKLDITDRARSKAKLESRSVILRAKQDIIRSALDNTRRFICNLPDTEYFDLIYKIIEKHKENREGVICFSKKDLDRLPKDFSEKVNSASEGVLSIQKTPVDIDGGFILNYGGIEVNCSFESFFSAHSELFSDEASKILFE